MLKQPLFLLLLSLPLLLAGCGQKGPLYLPETSAAPTESMETPS
ncbi:LPS translocon maturation chaperone LptM [Venatoribacter cucullus]|nr:lipoprotein [Venatoribacter cucullus]QQD22614.1 hypothetical protein GJQ54_12905 [Oceanospirillaceae bacterium ASx5O]UZK04630.1 hypothetical protein GAY96_12295 [Venatoribacter cucullus]